MPLTLSLALIDSPPLSLSLSRRSLPNLLCTVDTIFPFPTCMALAHANDWRKRLKTILTIQCTTYPVVTGHQPRSTTCLLPGLPFNPTNNEFSLSESRVDALLSNNLLGSRLLTCPLSVRNGFSLTGKRSSFHGNRELSSLSNSLR